MFIYCSNGVFIYFIFFSPQELEVRLRRELVAEFEKKLVKIDTDWRERMEEQVRSMPLRCDTVCR